MNICFSENLKKLRNEKGLTQENLADFLGISFQAISKWERGENYPDIETLFNLAMFFKVSIDDLLGFNKAENEKKILEIIENYDNLTDPDIKHKIITNSIEEFPTDFRIQLRQLGDIMFYGKDERNFKSNLPKVKRIYDNIQNNCTDDSIRICSKRYLAMYYHTLSHYLNDPKMQIEAEKLISQMPYMRDGQEFLSSYLYPFDHPKYKQKAQEAIDEELSILHHGIHHYMRSYIDESISLDLRIKTAELEVYIYNSFYNDGNFGSMWRNMMYLYGHLGHMYFQKGAEQKAFENLEKSAQLAKQFDKMDRITIMHSDIFDGKEFDKHTLGSTFVACSYIKHLMTEKYPLTNDFKQSDEFNRILQILE